MDDQLAFADSSFFWTTEGFTCSKVINSFTRKNSWTDSFPKSSKSHLLIFPKLSSQEMPQFGHTTILISSFSTVSARNAWDPYRTFVS